MPASRLGRRLGRFTPPCAVEQETESTANPGVFPHMSLGPGQRFASKGCYIVRPSCDVQGEFEAASEWLVP